MTNPNVLSMPARIPSAAFVRAFFEGFPGLWFLRDDNGIMIEVSSNFERLTGIPPEDVIGATITESGMCAEVDAAVRGVLETGVPTGRTTAAFGKLWTVRLFPVSVAGRRYVGGCAIPRFA